MKETDTKSGVPKPEPSETRAIPQPIPIPDISYIRTPLIPLPPPCLCDAYRVMTPVIPLPPPAPEWYLKFEQYMNEDQRKALAKMMLDTHIDLMNAQLELVNRFAQKQIDILKRVNEMIR